MEEETKDTYIQGSFPIKPGIWIAWLEICEVIWKQVCSWMVKLYKEWFEFYHRTADILAAWSNFSILALKLYYSVLHFFSYSFSLFFYALEAYTLRFFVQFTMYRLLHTMFSTIFYT